MEYSTMLNIRAQCENDDRQENPNYVEDFLAEKDCRHCECMMTCREVSREAAKLRGSGQIIPYKSFFQVYFKPVDNMPLVQHELIGDYIKIMLAQIDRKGIWGTIAKHLDLSRNLLDDWMMNEYDRQAEPDDHRMKTAYYGEGLDVLEPSAALCTSYIDTIYKITRILKVYYFPFVPPSAPVKEVLKHLNSALTRLEKLKAKK